MKKIALAAILLLLCISAVGAYNFQFIGPPRDSGTINGNVGDIITISGISQNIPPGVTMTLSVTGPDSFYSSRSMVIQDGGVFSTQFDTTGLKEGDYRFQIQATKYYEVSQPRNWFIYHLTDRSLLLTMLSPVRQDYDGWLSVNGMVDTLGADGIELTVYGPSGNYFGPQWISTDQNGRFYQEVSIDRAGVYSARIADRRGLIGTVQIQVIQEIVPTPVIPTRTPEPSIISASATASRENPAYFVMQTRSGTATISTSLGVDWVIEYIDESGNHHIINEYGAERAETFTIEGNGGTIHIRAYPDGGETGTVHLYGQNIVSLTTSTTASENFGDLVDPGQTPAEESPAFILMPLIALAILVICLVKKP